MPAEDRNVTIVALPDKPVAMVVRDTVPVCIKLCEPICARSEYEIGVTVFDRPVATIKVAGLTRFYNCEKA